MRFPFQRNKEVLLERVFSDRAKEVANLHALCFERHWGSAEIARLLNQQGVVCLLVRMVGRPDDSPLGFILIRHVIDEAEILSIGVSPGHRGRGLARKMLEEAVRMLHGEKTASLFLEVEEDNENAVHLYRNMKFKTVGERPSYYHATDGKKGLALVMRLDLV